MLSEKHALLNQMYVAICMYLSFMQMSSVMNLVGRIEFYSSGKIFLSAKRKGQGRRKEYFGTGEEKGKRTLSRAKYRVKGSGVILEDNLALFAYLVVN